jgi:hypothetical protein
MNQTNLHSLFDMFKLGIPADKPERVHGGLLHLMWRVNTDKAC